MPSCILIEERILSRHPLRRIRRFGMLFGYWQLRHDGRRSRRWRPAGRPWLTACSLGQSQEQSPYCRRISLEGFAVQFFTLWRQRPPLPGAEAMANDAILESSDLKENPGYGRPFFSSASTSADRSSGEAVLEYYIDSTANAETLGQGSTVTSLASSFSEKAYINSTIEYIDQWISTKSKLLTASMTTWPERCSSFLVPTLNCNGKTRAIPSSSVSGKSASSHMNLRMYSA